MLACDPPKETLNGTTIAGNGDCLILSKERAILRAGIFHILLNL
jgi:hypothetical protein